MPRTQNPPEKGSLCCLVQGIIEDTNTGIHPEPKFLLDLKNCYGQQGGCSLVHGWSFLVLPSWHVIHIHHRKPEPYSYNSSQSLDRCICIACLREAGYTKWFLQQLSVTGSLHLYSVLTRGWVYKMNAPAHLGLFTQLCPLPKNITPKGDIFQRCTGIPRMHGWQYRPSTLDGDISASFHGK